jgi:hypothetical protein
MVTVLPQPEHTRMDVASANCDLCGRVIINHREDGSSHLDEALRQRYGDALEVGVYLRAGERNLDGESYTETMAFDICPVCFHEVLKPFLESRGAEPEITHP